MAASPTGPARPYRFPALPEREEGDEQVSTRCTRQACGTCGASAVASCVALCCCPCAVVSCLTLALVKAPYVAGRRCVARIARRRLRKAGARRVRDLDDDGDGEKERRRQGPRRSKEELWGGDDLTRASDVDGDGGGREKVCSRTDVSEEVWVDMYQVGLWGFGRLSFSAAVGGGVGDLSEKDGDTAPE